MNIRKPQLTFGSLSERQVTDMIVIHHTGEVDEDLSAEEIHKIHINSAGYTGIGYHFVIRKDGTLELGRPEWAVGAHAYGENWHTLGIHICGGFEYAIPTNEQIHTCAELIRDLCSDYDIPCNRNHIVGHCDLMATACPGKNLYARIGNIISLANGDLPAPDVVDQPNFDFSIFDLSAKFESNNDCGAIGHGFGLFQFSEKTVDEFVYWLHGKGSAYAGDLTVTNDLEETWKAIAARDPEGFASLQKTFVKEYYFDNVANVLDKYDFTLNKHSFDFQSVMFARAIQHGVFGSVELLRRVNTFPNLSYIDSEYFDPDTLAKLYRYLIDNPNYGLSHHKYDDALRKRFTDEAKIILPDINWD